MAAVVALLLQNRRNLRRNRIFRDRSNPLDVYDDVELYRKFRFRRVDIMSIVDEVGGELEMSNRGNNVPSSIQVCVALRFYATGSFLSVCGDLVGISEATACRIVRRVTKALLRHARRWIIFPDQGEADRQKEKFFASSGFPSVFGCIDGTHIRIQAPRNNEHEYVNRKNFHSLNVQVICNADLMFIDVLAKWPGSVHDARILRQSRLFTAFEDNDRPLDGVMLGDGGYMIREWLLTPFQHPATLPEMKYNAAHSCTRSTVERAIGIAKNRWHCLRRLRVEPDRACEVTVVCFMLSNRARSLNLGEPDDDDDNDDDAQNNDEYDDNQYNDNVPAHDTPTERARVAAGQAVRNQFVNRFFL